MAKTARLSRKTDAHSRLDWQESRVESPPADPVSAAALQRQLSAGDPDAGNLLVQGDNLLALRALLPYYAGKVKCIYIDPPYNTGNEKWVYNDAVNSPEMRDWLGKVVGAEAEDLSRHDKWLCMMYPRLSLLREFLDDDGIIFVSVDENEYRFLANLMDEIFGEPNRLETLVWKKSYGGGSKSKHIVNLHEYIEVFCKRIDRVPMLELPPDEKALRYYRLRDSKYAKRGPYRLQPLATNSMDERPNLRYAIPHNGEEIWPEKQWQWERERTMTALRNDELVFTQGRGKNKGKWTVSYKQYLRDAEGEERTQKPYSIVEGVYTQQGTNDLKAMFGDGKAFAFPKPRPLIQHLLQFATDRDSLVLDSFAGSGTTGHAVLALNKADGGQRRFVLVEMEGDIAERVTRERLRMAVEGYENEPAFGGGFRFCTLGDPLFDEAGSIRESVKFSDLAAHVFFTETGSPIPKRANGKTPLLGVHDGTAIYLLFNGVMGDRRVNGGNVLTTDVLRNLPEPSPRPSPSKGEGALPKVVYGEGCRLSKARLKRAGVVFKQVPYEVKVN